MALRGLWSLTVLLVLCAQAVPACADFKTDIRLGARWKQGERRLVEFNQSIERTRGGRPELAARVTRKAELEVLEASPSGFLVRWRFVDASSSRPLTELPVIEWLHLLKDVTAEVETDRPGDFNAVRNWQEAGTQARAAAEKLLASNPGVKEADRTQFLGLVEAVFANGRTVSNYFAREIRLCTFMLGWYITPGKPESYPDTLANPFGGEPFPSRSTLLLREYDKKTGRAALRWWQNLNAEEATRILRESAAADAQRAGKPAPDPAEVPRLHIGDTADIVLDNSTGWIQSLTNRRVVTLRNGQEEMKEIRTLQITGKAP